MRVHLVWDWAEGDGRGREEKVLAGVYAEKSDADTERDRRNRNRVDKPAAEVTEEDVHLPWRPEKQ